MKKIYVIAFFLLLLNQIHGQKPVHFCGFDHYMKMKKLHDPEYYEGYNNLFRQWKSEGNNRGGGLYSLPVVFHVVYNNDSQNIPDSVIHSQLEVLNEDYRRMNADAVNTREIFQPIAADCHIEFVLATIDPDGNPTTGITHTYTDRTEFEMQIFSQDNTLDEVKHSEDGGVDAWDTQHYINIWICNMTIDFPGATIFGMSYPPEGLDNWPNGSGAADSGDDGVIMHYTTVGRNNPVADDDGTSDNNMGRTLTHEMGHYLGLRHTWGDEFFTDICSEDDGIDDTPLCGSGDQYSCDFEANTCDDESGNDMPDMLENYMDYTRDECYNMFTDGQKSLMRYVIEELRNELLQPINTPEKPMVNIKVYPNPANDVLNISLPSEIRNPQFFVFNVTGEKVLQGSLQQSRLDVSELASGTYALHVEIGESPLRTIFIVK